MTATREDIAALFAIINSHRISRMLQLVAKLDVADRIATAQFLPVTSLASEVGVLADPLLRILRALASVGIFIVDEGGMIGHLRLSLLLRTDSTSSLRPAARFFAGDPPGIARHIGVHHGPQLAPVSEFLDDVNQRRWRLRTQSDKSNTAVVQSEASGSPSAKA